MKTTAVDAAPGGGPAFKKAMEALGGPVVMVGDRCFDVEGAKAFGMDCMGVTYGYGSREELLGAGATYLADSAADIARRILE